MATFREIWGAGTEERVDYLLSKFGLELAYGVGAPVARRLTTHDVAEVCARPSAL